MELQTLSMKNLPRVPIFARGPFGPLGENGNPWEVFHAYGLQFHFCPRHSCRNYPFFFSAETDTEKKILFRPKPNAETEKNILVNIPISGREGSFSYFKFLLNIVPKGSKNSTIYTQIIFEDKKCPQSCFMSQYLCRIR